MTKKRLEEYCDAEFENIDAVISELFSVLKPKKNKYSIAELAAIATFIHNFYNGIENILKMSLQAQNVKVNATPTWHKDLLERSKKLNIISVSLYDELLEYLSFRHFFVHAYSFHLKWKELKPLAVGIKDLSVRFKTAISGYIGGIS